MLLFLFQLLLVRASLAQAPTSKCTPDQWDGAIFGVSGYRSAVVSFSTNVSYDYTNKQEAFNQTIYLSANSTVQLSVYRFWNESREYITFPEKKRCGSRRLYKQQMKRFCNDTDGATLVTSLVVGNGTNDVYKIGKKLAFATITLIDDSFIPVSAAFFLKLGKYSRSVSVQYGNITAGIKDSSVFVLPDYCKKAKQKLLAVKGVKGITEPLPYFP